MKDEKFYNGTFGLNDYISKKDFNKMLESAEKIINSKLSFPDNKKFSEKMTRAEAVELVINAMCSADIK